MPSGIRTRTSGIMVDINVLPSTSVSGFQGPGDIIPSALVWWGLRAYSSATAGTKAIRVIRTSDGTAQDISTLSASAGGRLNLSDPFFDGSTTYRILTWYDKSGNGNDVTQVTSNKQAILNLSDSGLNNLPTASFVQANAQFYVAAVPSLRPTIPLYTNAVVNDTFNGTTQRVVANISNSGGIGLFFTTTINTVGLYGGATLSATASETDGSWHLFQGVSASSTATSYIKVDNNANVTGTIDTVIGRLSDATRLAGNPWMAKWSSVATGTATKTLHSAPCTPISIATMA